MTVMCSKAIKESVQIMDPDEEYITIASAEEQMSLTAAARKKELDEARSKMKGARASVSRTIFTHSVTYQALAKSLEAARISSTRPASVPSADAHTNTLNKLEDTRLSLAKAINEMESALASKESEKSRLREELHALEESDPAAEHDLDSTAYVIASFLHDFEVLLTLLPTDCG